MSNIPRAEQTGIGSSCHLFSNSHSPPTNQRKACSCPSPLENLRAPHPPRLLIVEAYYVIDFRCCLVVNCKWWGSGKASLLWTGSGTWHRLWLHIPSRSSHFVAFFLFLFSYFSTQWKWWYKEILSSSRRLLLLLFLYVTRTRITTDIQIRYFILLLFKRHREQIPKSLTWRLIPLSYCWPFSQGHLQPAHGLARVVSCFFRCFSFFSFTTFWHHLYHSI